MVRFGGTSAPGRPGDVALAVGRAGACGDADPAGRGVGAFGLAGGRAGWPVCARGAAAGFGAGPRGAGAARGAAPGPWRAGGAGLVAVRGIVAPAGFAADGGPGAMAAGVRPPLSLGPV